MPGLCCDVLHGQNFQYRHKRLIIEYGADLEDLILSTREDVSCALPAAAVEGLSLFPDLRESCKPIAAKSQRFSHDEKTFIADEIELLRYDIIEECRSPTVARTARSYETDGEFETRTVRWTIRKRLTNTWSWMLILFRELKKCCRT